MRLETQVFSIEPLFRQLFLVSKPQKGKKSKKEMKK